MENKIVRQEELAKLAELQKGYIDSKVFNALYEDPTNGYEYIDMGEAGIWAKYPIGISEWNSDWKNTIKYFEWGGIEGYTISQVGVDKEFSYHFTDYRLSGEGATTSRPQFTKYCRNPRYGKDLEFTDNLTTLEPEDDACVQNMGENWRMPTQEEFQKLCDLCNIELIENYNNVSGLNGRLFKLKTDNSKQLFFPVTGYCEDGLITDFESDGNFWASFLSTYDVLNGCCLCFNSGDIYPDSESPRNWGQAIIGILDITNKQEKYLTKSDAENTYATIEVVDEKIAEAALSGEVDLSNYVTKEELALKADANGIFNEIIVDGNPRHLFPSESLTIQIITGEGLNGSIESGGSSAHIKLSLNETYLSNREGIKVIRNHLGGTVATPTSSDKNISIGYGDIIAKAVSGVPSQLKLEVNPDGNIATKEYVDNKIKIWTLLADITSEDITKIKNVTNTSEELIELYNSIISNPAQQKILFGASGLMYVECNIINFLYENSILLSSQIKIGSSLYDLYITINDSGNCVVNIKQNTDVILYILDEDEVSTPIKPDVDGIYQLRGANGVTLSNKNSEHTNYLEIGIDETLATREYVDDKINFLVNEEGQLEDSFDTLKEVDTWIKEHEGEAAEIITDVNKLKSRTPMIPYYSSGSWNNTATASSSDLKIPLAPWPMEQGMFPTNHEGDIILPAATSEKAGVMSATDKLSLDNLVKNEVKTYILHIDIPEDLSSFEDITKITNSKEELISLYNSNNSKVIFDFGGYYNINSIICGKDFDDSIIYTAFNVLDSMLVNITFSLQSDGTYDLRILLDSSLNRISIWNSDDVNDHTSFNINENTLVLKGRNGIKLRYDQSDSFSYLEISSSVDLEELKTATATIGELRETIELLQLEIEELKTNLVKYQEV